MTMRSFILLTRPLNLAIIAITMVMMRHGVLGTLLEAGGRSLQMPLLHFVLLVLSTVLIAAGGNVINDYFDTRIDRINKPDAVIVGRRVKRRVAMAGHLALSGTGLLLGLYVAWASGLMRWALIPVFAIGALWSYSTTFKRRLAVGNGTVAVLTALVPLTVGLYEIPLLHRAYAEVLVEDFGDAEMAARYFRVLWAWILAYTAFAFLSTLVRELQKDMADVKGDAADGCRTLPIVWGMRWAKAITLTYTAVIIIGLLLVRRAFLNDALSFWYIGAIMVLLLVAAGLTWSAASRSEHVRAGRVTKAAMVMAVSYAALIAYTL